MNGLKHAHAETCSRLNQQLEEYRVHSVKQRDLHEVALQMHDEDMKRKYDQFRSGFIQQYKGESG
jgi:hypothetical protein